MSICLHTHRLKGSVWGQSASKACLSLFRVHPVSQHPPVRFKCFKESACAWVLCLSPLRGGLVVTSAGRCVGKEFGPPWAAVGLWGCCLSVSVPPGLSLGSESGVRCSDVLSAWLSGWGGAGDSEQKLRLRRERDWARVIQPGEGRWTGLVLLCLFLIWGLPFLVLGSPEAHSFVHQTKGCLFMCVYVCVCEMSPPVSVCPSFCLFSVISLWHSVLSSLSGSLSPGFLKTFAHPLYSISYTICLVLSLSFTPLL